MNAMSVSARLRRYRPAGPPPAWALALWRAGLPGWVAQTVSDYADVLDELCIDPGRPVRVALCLHWGRRAWRMRSLPMTAPGLGCLRVSGGTDDWELTVTLDRTPLCVPLTPCGSWLLAAPFPQEDPCQAAPVPPAWASAAGTPSMQARSVRVADVVCEDVDHVADAEGVAMWLCRGDRAPRGRGEAVTFELDVVPCTHDEELAAAAAPIPVPRRLVRVGARTGDAWVLLGTLDEPLRTLDPDAEWLPHFASKREAPSPSPKRRRP